MKPDRAKLWKRKTLLNRLICLLKGHYWQPHEYSWSIATTFNCWRCGLTREYWFGPFNERKPKREYFPAKPIADAQEGGE